MVFRELELEKKIIVSMNKVGFSRLKVGKKILNSMVGCCRLTSRTCSYRINCTTYTNE